MKVILYLDPTLILPLLILYSSFTSSPLSGIFSDVLNYVLKHGKGANTEVATEQKKVEDKDKPREKPLFRERGLRVYTNELIFVKCFQFLKALATKNVEVQQR